jgi:hypothetical protein
LPSARVEPCIQQVFKVTQVNQAGEFFGKVKMLVHNDMIHKRPSS